ncbi:hypothetical protein PUN28_001738 [Cardiocondyla obscurior]|uniref:Uncharacterized protein n=1 Tax=Cardiocondyla obscurior TaxID=286306 RepID=A0AAW2GQY0_9HYME
MVELITICNSVCITCVWCILFSVCFPIFSRNLRKVDSSECCVRRKPTQKRRGTRLHNIPRCVRTESIYARKNFKDSPCVDRNCKDQLKCRSRRKEKMYSRSGERKDIRPCSEKNQKTLQICSKQIECSNSCSKSEDSLNKKD